MGQGSEALQASRVAVVGTDPAGSGSLFCVLAAHYTNLGIMKANKQTSPPEYLPCIHFVFYMEIK